MRTPPARALLLALLILVLSPPAPARAEGSRRTVLVEFFCTQGCQWAETAAAALDRVAEEFGTDRILAVEYNLDLEPGLFERRFYLYVPPGTHVPFAFFDGSRLGIYGSNNDVEESYRWYRDATQQELAAPSPLRLESAVQVSAGGAAFEVRLTNVSAETIAGADLYLGLYEKARIGRTARLLRYLNPGLPLEPLAPGEPRLVAQQLPPLAPGVDLSRVAGLAFVQLASDSAVLQAAPAAEPWLALRPASLAMVIAAGSEPASQAIVVDGLGAPFRWWLEAPPADWLQVEPPAGKRGEFFTITLDPTGMPRGTYRERLVVRTDGPFAPAEREIAITLHVATQVHTTFLPLLACP